MEDSVRKAIAAQLRKPHGDYAVEVGKKMNEGNRAINLTTIESLHLKSGDAVLEIGMGNGFFVKNVVSGADLITYVGCDYSEAMVKEAQKLNADFVKEGCCNFYETNADRLPFKDEVFDKVFSVNTVYFWEDCKAVLAELRRVMKPDGLLVLAIRPKSVMDRNPLFNDGFSTFSKNDLIALVSENGFKVNDVLEEEEPDQELSGEQLGMETLLIRASKS